MRIVWIVSIIATLQYNASAQTSEIADTTTHCSETIYATFGIGLVGPGLGVMMGVTSTWGSSSINFRWESGSEMHFRGGPINDIEAVSLQYGWHWRSSRTLLKVSAGPAYFRHTRGMDYYLFGDSSGSSFEVGGKIEFSAMRILDNTFAIGAIGGFMLGRDFLYPCLTIALSVGKVY